MPTTHVSGAMVVEVVFWYPIFWDGFRLGSPICGHPRRHDLTLTLPSAGRAAGTNGAGPVPPLGHSTGGGSFAKGGGSRRAGWIFRL